MHQNALLTSMLQCTTPRRPYVIDGTSDAIQLELLYNTKIRNATKPRREIKGAVVLTHLTSIASTSPMRSYNIPDMGSESRCQIRSFPSYAPCVSARHPRNRHSLSLPPLPRGKVDPRRACALATNPQPHKRQRVSGPCHPRRRAHIDTHFALSA